VLMGTCFAASAESLWAESMKERLITADGDETEQTQVFDIVRNAPWPSHYPGRAVRNAFSARWNPNEQELRDSRTQIEKVWGRRPTTSRRVWFGQVKEWT
jgi:nitronate monooxygenase